MGNLEISLESGKKVLNGPNSNYSYGRLQRVFELAFKKEGLRAEDLGNVLVLGFGGGSVARVLREQIGFAGTITAVELDEVIIAIGKEHFPKAFDKIDLVQTDALQFVKEDQQRYDLIIIDLFIDDRALSESYSTDFLTDIRQSLSPKGKVLHNLMLRYDTTKAASANYEAVFPTVRRHVLLGTNLAIVAEA